MEDTESLQLKEAKVHINTLSSFKGFGGGTYKMTVVKEMTATEDFWKMPSEDRKCKSWPYEVCRGKRLLEKCNCVPFEVPGVQVGVC